MKMPVVYTEQYPKGRYLIFVICSFLSYYLFKVRLGTHCSSVGNRIVFFDEI